MSLLKNFKKAIWFFDAKLAENNLPLNKDLTYFAITGTDGKTTTSTFLYEIAKELGHKPLLITTVGAKFLDEDIDLNIKSSTFFSYSLKSSFEKFKNNKIIDGFKSLFFQDRNGYETQTEQHRTTPLASEIRKAIIEYSAKGADIIILETTSHAIDQYRLLGIKFDSIGFTNITSEHLDYHENWENYAATKAKLIDMVKPNGSVILNESDEKSFNFLIQYFENKKTRNLHLITYKAENLDQIDLKKFLIKVENNSAEKTRISANSLKDLEPDQKYLLSHIDLFGKFNIYNALAAFSIFYGFNNSKPENIAKAIGNLKSVKGRMSIINENPKVIIDYAHTTNAMFNALTSIDKCYGKIWVIFGCTGLRDKYKRPEMGKISFENADNIMITADDVRTERLYEINNQIIEGFKNREEDFTIYTYYPELEYKNDEKKFIIRFDEPSPKSRRNAIKFAIENASPEDTIIMLGIGHQNTILIGETDYEWNDEKVAREYLKSNEN